MHSNSFFKKIVLETFAHINRLINKIIQKEKRNRKGQLKKEKLGGKKNGAS